jgi:hypothetical protein
MRQFQKKLTILVSLFVGTASAQVLPNAHPSQFILVTAPASDSVTVTLTIPPRCQIEDLVCPSQWQKRQREVDVRNLSLRGPTAVLLPHCSRYDEMDHLRRKHGEEIQP